MDRVWISRLRWRLRGAWLWPAFTLLTLGDGLALHTWPVSGLRTDLVPALLLAAGVNIAVVATAAPLVARVIRRRRADLPRMIAADYAGVALLGLLAIVWITMGLLHRGDVQAERRASARALDLMRAAVAHHAPRAVRANVALAETIRVDPSRLYRSCIPTETPDRPWCVLVHLDTQPPRVVFSGHEPNRYWGPRSG